MRPLIAELAARNQSGVACRCGGYADEAPVGPTPDEIRAYDCGRAYACCTAAHKCRICGLEFIVQLDAPGWWGW